MERTNVARGLRIAVSVVYGILCVLLVVLWVRSYWWLDMTPYTRFGHLSSAKGTLYVKQALEVPEGIAYESSYFGFWKMPFNDRQTVVATGKPGFALPYWSLVVFTSVLTATPWLSWRFSLRTMLIATTLIAVVLGLCVWMSR